MAMWMDDPNPPVKVMQAIDLIGVEPPESYVQIVINPFLKGIFHKCLHYIQFIGIAVYSVLVRQV